MRAGVRAFVLTGTVEDAEASLAMLLGRDTRACATCGCTITRGTLRSVIAVAGLVISVRCVVVRLSWSSGCTASFVAGTSNGGSRSSASCGTGTLMELDFPAAGCESLLLACC